MSDDTFSYEDDDVDGGNAVQVLRAKLKEANKAIAELRATNTQLSEQVTATSLATLFDKHEIPAKFQKIYSKAGFDATPEGMAAFLEEYGELWGATQEEVSPEVAETQDAMAKMAAAEQAARNPSHTSANIRTGELAQMDYSTLMKFMDSIPKS